jgi:putative redox protein
MEAKNIERVSEDTTSYPVSVEWIDKMKFLATEDRKHSILIDTLPESGGEDLGPTPSRLLLMAVAACTSMDIVSILEKSRQNLTGLKVSARGVQIQEYPKYYSEIHLFYNIRGKDLDFSRVERAIKLSEEKYCSVGATVSGRARIYIKYRLEQDQS